MQKIPAHDITARDTTGQDPVEPNSADIAIVGIGCRLPGASTVDELWDLVSAGASTFEQVPAAESRRFGYSDRHVADPDFVPVRSALADFDAFDHEFFAISARDAALMDPQHRVFLETVWAAIEDSGHAGDHQRHNVGLFGSSSSSTYLAGPVAEAGLWDSTDINFSAMLANDKDFLCTRASYTLGLTGLSVVVQSACSSSLLAVHLACAALRRGDCDTAVVGGVSISLPHLGGYLHRTGGIFSRSGRCTPFDSAADGTVKANGAAAVVLRRAADATADRDHVYATIAGSAVNNDGRDKVGYPAPGVSGQAAVIAAALRQAGDNAARVGYIETHGTGTPIGDPIEIRALDQGRRAVQHTGDEPVPSYLGSLKATMGHLDAAAGVAGLIKAALVLDRRSVPPLAGTTTPNPLLRLTDKGFHLPLQLLPAPDLWAAAVSSFGMGGTNVHVVLRRAPEPGRDPQPSGRQLVTVYGSDREAVLASCGALRRHLQAHPDLRLDDVAFTLGVGRLQQSFAVQLAAGSVAELIARLADPTPAPAAELTDRPPVDAGSARRVPLPGTVLRRRRHWVTPAAVAPEIHAVQALSIETSNADRGKSLHREVSLDAVHAIVATLLAEPDLELDDDIFDSGADSMTAIDLIAELKDAFGIGVEYAQLELTRTVRALTTLITELATPSAGDGPVSTVVLQALSSHAQAAVPTANASNLIEVSRTGTRNLFLVHPAGGTTTCYVELARHTGDDLNIIGLYFPERYLGEQLTMRDLAERYLAAIRDHQPTGPYLIGGYSFGGNLAVEIALRLESAGEVVERLVMIDSHPPHAYTFGDCPEQSYLQAFPRLLEVLIPDIRFTETDHATITAPEQVLAAVSEPAWNASTRRELGHFFRIWQENHGVLKRWTPDRDLGCPVLIFEAQRPEPPEILQQLHIADSSVREWQRYLTGQVDYVPVEGDHYSIVRDRDALQVMGRTLCDALR